MKNKLRITAFIMFFAMLLVLTIIPMVSVAPTTAQQETGSQVIAAITVAQTAAPPVASFAPVVATYPVFTSQELTQVNHLYTNTMVKMKNIVAPVANNQSNITVDNDVGLDIAATTLSALSINTKMIDQLTAAGTDTHDIQMIAKMMDSGLTRHDSSVGIDAGLLRVVSVDTGFTGTTCMDITESPGAISSQVTQASNISQAITGIDQGKMMTAAAFQHQMSQELNDAVIFKDVEVVTKQITTKHANDTGFALVA